MTVQERKSPPSLYLGINKGAHDAALCLIDDRGPRPRVELLLKERWTRVKADGHDVSGLARLLQERLQGESALFAQSSFLLRPDAVEVQLDRLCGYFDYLKRSGIGFISSRLNPELRFLPHHYCHAMAAAAVSPFERSILVVFDGAGSSPEAFSAGHEELLRFPPPNTRSRNRPVAESLSVYLQDGPKLECVRKHWQTLVPFEKDERVRLSDGLGMFYENAAVYIFNSRRDSGKVMGLAPFGEAIPVEDRAAFYRGLNWTWAFRGRGKEAWQRSGRFRYYADIAATVQRHFERSLMELLLELRERHPWHPNLILTGGCALNCVTNNLAAASGLFRGIYVPPFPSDESIAFGAAQHLRLREAKRPWSPVPWSQQRADLGWSGSRPSAAPAWPRARALGNPAAEAAKLLSRGRIVAWFQGRSECGPRALGFRSILANPLQRGVRDRLNRRIKRREDFRPYGCSVLLERAAEYFEVDAQFESPFMSFAPKVRSSWAGRLKEVTHTDGTSRVQTVRRSQNAALHALIAAFGRRTGLFAVLNTSLNVMGEPIVEREEDARRFLQLVPVDAMIYGKWLITRESILSSSRSAGLKPRPIGRPKTKALAWKAFLEVSGR